MALPKKRSKSIKVNDMDFRYIISSSMMDDDWNFSINLTIQIASGEGCVLKIDGIVTRKPWLEISELKQYEKADYPVLRPSVVG